MLSRKKKRQLSINSQDFTKAFYKKTIALFIHFNIILSFLQSSHSIPPLSCSSLSLSSWPLPPLLHPRLRTSARLISLAPVSTAPLSAVLPMFLVLPTLTAEIVSVDPPRCLKARTANTVESPRDSYRCRQLLGRLFCHRTARSLLCPAYPRAGRPLQHPRRCPGLNFTFRLSHIWGNKDWSTYNQEARYQGITVPWV